MENKRSGGYGRGSVPLTSPHLPCHDEGTADGSRAVLSTSKGFSIFLAGMRHGTYAKIGVVEPFNPIPMPISKRVMNNCSQLWLTAPPIGVKIRKIAEMKMAPRRPK